MNASDERNQRQRETKTTPLAPEPASDTERVKAETIRTPQVFAGACPASEAHVNTRVYRTLREVRYCVCDDCGRTWKKIGPAAGARGNGERASA